MPPYDTNFSNILGVGEAVDPSHPSALQRLQAAQAGMYDTQNKYYQARLDELGKTSFGDILGGVSTGVNTALGIASYFDKQPYFKKQMEGMDVNIANAIAANTRKENLNTNVKTAFA